VVAQCAVSVFPFTIFWTCWFIIKHCQSIFLSKWHSKSSKAKFFSKTAATHFTHFTVFSTISAFSVTLLFWCYWIIFSEMKVEVLKNLTFSGRQWAQCLLFLCFFQHLFQSFWSSLFDVNQLFSQKWDPKLSKANFCSKTVCTEFAVFCSFWNIFPNQFDQ